MMRSHRIAILRLLEDAQLVGLDFMGHAGVDEGVFLAAVRYPIAPRAQAGLEAQVSMGRAADDLDSAVDGIGSVARTVGVL